MKKITTLLLSLGIVGGLNAAITSGVELIGSPIDDPGAGAFGSGFTNYRAMDSAVWHEKYGSGDATNDTANGREVLQHDTNSTVPTATEGAYWAGFAPDATFTDPAIYYSLGIWETGNATDFDIGFDLGDRSNSTFGSFQIQLVYADGGFADGDAVDLATATGYTIVDTTATYTDANFTGSTANTRTITGLTDTLDITGISNNQELWVVLTASGDGTQSFVDNLSVTAVVPEPSAYALIGGFLALGWVMVRRRG